MKSYFKSILFYLLIFTSIPAYSQQGDYAFYHYKDPDGWGLKYSNGEKLFENNYDSLIVFPYYKNRIRVKKNDYWGVIDSMGTELIPSRYAYIENDPFGYRAYSYYSNNLVISAYLSMNGDTVVPFGPYSVFSRSIGNGSNYFVLLMGDEGKEAIYSSDGIKRVDFDLLNVWEIDSVPFFQSSVEVPVYYYAIESTDNKFGVYDGLGKKIVVEPIYDFVCYGWCKDAINPHFREGSVLYTGDNRVFVMVKDDHPVVIRKNGDILFSSDTISYSKTKAKYYLSEEGKLTRVEGKCMENKDFPPPYIMKDDKGYFLVNKDGSYFEGTKEYHDLITKDQCAERYGSVYLAVTDNGKLGLMDLTGKWLLRQKYESCECNRRNKKSPYFILKEGGVYKYFDPEFNELPYAPGTVKELPSILMKDSLYGVMDVDSSWLIKPEYTSHSFILDARIRKVMGYVFQKKGEYIDLYDTIFHKTHRFKTKEYLVKGNFYINDQQYLFLYDEKQVSIYDLPGEKWIIKEQPFGIWPGGAVQQLDSSIYFYLVDNSDNLYILDTSGQQLFKTSVKSEWKIIPTLVSYPDELILRKTYFNKDNYVEKMEFQNRAGKLIEINDGTYSRDYSLMYHPKSKTYLLRAVYRGTEIKVYNKDLDLVRTTNEHLKTFDSFYATFDKDKKEYHIYTAPDTIALTLKTDWIAKTKYGSSARANTDSGHVLLNEYTLKAPLRYYRSTAIYLGKKGMIIMRRFGEKEDDNRYDLFAPSGELLLENYEFASKSRSTLGPEYFVFENEKEQIWLTDEAIIYHRIIKE